MQCEIGDHVLCQLADIPDGKSKGFLPLDREDRVFAVRRGEQVYVYMNACPHEWISLEFARDRFLGNADQDIVCYAHGAHFNIETGHCFHGPCASRDLIKVPHRISDGRVIISLPLPAVPSRHSRSMA